MAGSVHALAAGGDLDRSFDDDGRTLASIHHFADVEIQSDGKIVLAGAGGLVPQFAAYRLLPNGAPDPGFGDGGRVATEVGEGPSQAHAVAIQPDGKILVGGLTADTGQHGRTVDMALVRYGPSGTPDPTFGGDGEVAIDLGGAHDELWDVAVQDDGKILIVGDTGEGFNGDLVVARLESDGSVDATFGSSGVIVHDVGPGQNEPSSVALRPDDRIVVLGCCAPDASGAWVSQFSPDGDLDPSFADGGVLVLDDWWRDMALQPNGKLVLAGDRGSSFGVARLRRDGELDPGFGDSGFALMPRLEWATAEGVVLDLAGGIIAVGNDDDESPGDLENIVLARWHRNGTIDRGFGEAGSVVTSYRGWSSGAEAVAAAPDGGLIVAGRARVTGAVFRYLTCTIRGTRASETLIGTPGSDVICGGAGDDVIVGLGGDDALYGDSGSDALDGDAGGDDLFGGDGSDEALGREGADRILGGAGADAMDGGPGSDTVDLSDAPGRVRVNLAASPQRAAGGGGDTIAGFENVRGGAGPDRIVGSSGANVIDGGLGADRLLGRGGRDTVSYVSSTAYVEIDLSVFPQAVSERDPGEATGDRINGFESVIGTDLGDELHGSSKHNHLFGRYAGDSLSGGPGDDVLIGGLDSDSINGGPGIDVCDSTEDSREPTECEA